MATTKRPSAGAMRQLWTLLAGVYGSSWVQVHGLEDSDGVWGRGLADLTDQQLAAGVSACVERGAERAKRQQPDYPPTLGEFRGMCELASSRALGVTPVDRAWREAVAKSHHPDTAKWSHPIVRQAGDLTGWFDIRMAVPSPAAVEKRFATHYAELAGCLARGESMAAAPALQREESVERYSRSLADDQVRDLAQKTPAELRADLLAIADRNRRKVANRHKRH